MKYVQTVLGSIPAIELGVCDSHAHVIIDHPYTRHRFPDYDLPSVDYAIQELAVYAQKGGKAMVDAMPGNCGRCVLKLAEISKRTSVHLIASTGFHLDRYYSPGSCGGELSEKEMMKRMLQEIEEGIHEDGNITNHKAGVIKIAMEEKWRLREEKIFRAASQVHRQTGISILTHTENGKAALEQVELFQKEGVNLQKVVLSHTDRQPDVGYHREILSTGVGVEYDSGFRWKVGNPTADLVIELKEKYGDQILLGMDAARACYWKSYGGTPGLSFLIQEFKEILQKRGLTDLQWEKIMIQNPANYFSRNLN